jgi:membrane protease YdiL (CAAX protease family)
VVEVLLRGSAWQITLAILAATVVAPLVEETVFRGLLSRHLREATSRLSTTKSVLFSGILSGLIFASIHPQGMLAVPLLATLALAFALVREWRGNLLPAMVAHGINNGILTLKVLGMAG